MVLINYAGREINAKIVYYGPGLSGKTTNLECIYASVPQQSRGKMVSMKTRQDRTLFFDFLPLELGEVHGFRTRFLLYTVPGQVFYNATRKLVLKGADAVVFVADSGLGKMDDNRESLHNLDENLREQGLSLDTLPFVLQYNKRDLPQVYSLEELDAGLNPHAVPRFEAAAASGQGVYETLHAVSRLLFQRLMNDLRPGAGRPAAGAAAPQAPAAVAVANPPAARSVAPTAPRPAAPAPAPRPVPSAAPLRSATEPPIRRAPPLEPAGFPASAGAGAPVATAPPPVRTVPQVAAAPVAAPNFEPVSAGPQFESVADPELAPGVAGDYATYGHVIDLGADAETDSEPVLQTGFIKDPLRKAEPGLAAGGRGVTGPAPTRTQQVTISVPRSELRPGGTIRIVLDIRVEP